MEYTSEDKFSFARKDWLVLFETIYKANSNIIASALSKEELSALKKEDVEQVINGLKEKTLEIVKEIWNKSREEIKNEPPF